MKSSVFLALGVVASVAIVSAQAQTYQWKDSNGRTVISDTPPPGKAGSSRALGVAMPTSSKEKAADSNAAGTPKSTAEKDMEFKKRQLEAKEKTEREAAEQAAAQDRQENCERARRNLAALESSRQMVGYDNKGEPQFMDAGQREQEAERIRRIMNEACK